MMVIQLPLLLRAQHLPLRLLLPPWSLQAKI
jgi:hypothetical protein